MEIANFAVVKRTSIYIDLVFCLLVLPLMTFCYPVERWFYHFPGYMSLLVIWLYAAYAVNRLLTVPLLFGRRRCRLAGAGLILLSMLVTYLFASYELYIPKPNIHDSGFTPSLPYAQPYQQMEWSLFLIVEAFSFAIGLLVEAGRLQARRREVEGERDKAEISLYKARIKPHFLFNTLNSLYGLFLTGSERALPALERFISMMRYMNITAGSELVPLSDEADYIEQYVELQKLRLCEKTKVNLAIDINNPDMPVPPMLLVTFVENCFKHGVSPVEECFINITLWQHDDLLEFSTLNRIFSINEDSDHTGVENCRKRLALLYPDCHSLEICNDEDLFSVKLSINLDSPGR